MINVLCCVQARYASKRLPGKVLMKISGKPLIEHIIERLKMCENIDKIVLATSKDKRNDALEKTARKIEVDVFRGPELDVLARFCRVIRKYKPRHVVRICADSPLIDPVEIDKIITRHIRKKADYSFNHIPAMGNNYPDGIGAEVFKSSLLLSIEKKKTTKKEREHVNEFVWNNLKKFHVETLSAPPDIAYPEYRFEVNTKRELDFIRKIYKALYRGGYFSTGDVIKYLNSINRRGAYL